MVGFIYHSGRAEEEEADDDGKHVLSSLHSSSSFQELRCGEIRRLSSTLLSISLLAIF
jgi:hypothetical protein